MRELDAGFVCILDSPDAPPIARRHICNFGGGGGGTTTATKTQETQLPGWVNTASQDNYKQAQEAANNLQGPYQGQRVADMTAAQQGNIQALQNNVGSTNPNYAAAQGATSNFMNWNAPQVSAGQLSNTNLSPYMNPYTSSVIQGGLQALDVQRQQGLNAAGQQAQQARAFGGSRHGIQEGITNAGAATAAGNLYSNQMSQNFMQAQNAANSDIGRRYAADAANQQAAINSAGINLNAANQLGSLTTQGQNAYLQGLQGAMGGQDQLYQQQQMQLDAQRRLYGEQGQLPLQRLQILQSGLSNSPYGQTVTSTAPQESTSGSGLMTGLGAASSLVGIAGSVAAMV